MKASFFERLIAYVVDTIIVGIIATIICIGIPEKETDIEERMSKLTTDYMTGEISQNEFFDEYSELLYTNQKDNMLETGVSLVITIAYFVVFQYMNKGQTLGKKILKLRVVDKDTKEPANMVKGLIRSLIILGIASSAIGLILVSITNEKTFTYTYLTVGAIEAIFSIVTIIMMLYKKDGRGLHDMMANTTVIKEGR